MQNILRFAYESSTFGTEEFDASMSFVMDAVGCWEGVVE